MKMVLLCMFICLAASIVMGQGEALLPAGLYIVDDGKITPFQEYKRKEPDIPQRWMRSLSVSVHDGAGQAEEREPIKYKKIADEKLSGFSQKELAVLRDNPSVLKETMDRLKKPAESGVPSAQTSLGFCYGLSKDYSESVRWYQKAAEQGDADAQLRLGLAYKNGEGVSQNYDEGIKWLSRAAGQGYALAQYFLGSSYSLTNQGVQQNYVTALMWLTLSKWNGCAEGKEAADNLEKGMSSSLIAEALELARNWKPKE